MKELKRRLLFTTLPGSTLLETITASVILMIVFVMAMDTLTQLTVFNNEDANGLVVENDLKKCQRQICLDEIMPRAKTFKYDWGEINVNISNYKVNIYEVDMVAIANNHHRKVHFRFLKANE
jgi:hypothetical protein